MQTTKTKTRSAELTDALAAATAELTAAQSRLGEAVADDNIHAAKAARAEVERMEKVASELRAALPICRKREAEQAQAERERQRRAAEKAANKARAARVAAAKRVDKILADLGKAYRDYLRTDAGGDGTSANLLARRQRHAASAALFHHAPELALVIEPRRRPMRAHYEPLADSVGKTVRSYPEDEDHAE
ncbi:MAG: hypothetical protein GC161_16270 [Planctomycetaceae bacterium]|nr:hypothetical protein [Planctomycetaceae bacterium]